MTDNDRMPLEVLQYVRAVGMRDDDVLRELREQTKALVSQGVDVEMQLSQEQATFLAFFAKSLGVKKAIEVGVFTGYSSLVLARGLPPDGKLVAIDRSDEHSEMCREFWRRGGVSDRIDYRLGDGLDQLDRMIASGERGSYDWCFHDADKERVNEYVERFLDLLRPGGVLLVDNVLRGGHIVDDPAPGPGTAAMQRLNQRLHDDDRIDWCLLPIGDGLGMGRKR